MKDDVKITFKPEKEVRKGLRIYRGEFQVQTNNEALKEILSHIEYKNLTHIFDLKINYPKFKKLLEKGKEVTVTTNYDELKEELSDYAFTYNLWEQANKKVKNKKRKREKIAIAKEKGEEVFLWSYNESCNDPKAQCDIDLVNVYIDKNGEIREERIHAY